MRETLLDEALGIFGRCTHFLRVVSGEMMNASARKSEFVLTDEGVTREYERDRRGISNVKWKGGT